MKFLLAVLLLSTFAFAQDDYSSGGDVSPQGDVENETAFVNGASDPSGEEGRSIASSEDVQEEPAQQGEFFTGATNP